MYSENYPLNGEKYGAKISDWFDEDGVMKTAS
jgi:hypothetical protein